MVVEIEAQETSGHVLVAFDSSLGSSVAVCRDGRVWQASSDDPRGHAEVIGTLLDESLKAAGVNPKDVTGVVSGVGPGPFTGLRVGIAAAQTFALGVAAPLLPVKSHDAAALEVIETGAAASVRVVQDAKRRELFVSDYAALDWAGVPVLTGGPRIEAREGYEPADHEVWPERVSAAKLLQVAARRLAAGATFEAPEALYLRQPDVKAPAAVKRVSS
ncbi:tRNA (adenosine(37)-N6)-threonylcarbamoyltransferase complex dimerization subunit type 1 TsaB [Leucobacter chinensis]|uniref:tRNA (adenosine(37)-N6)-threonylcarbamoyltransferase complex dimerization subunit type 1 TsaB n=1 Tax=Leucobacter chinensis TaxID=2851010 RepID=UPI00350EAD32